MTVTEEQLINIETKLAHQEYMLAELNDVLSLQQQQIMTLEQRVQALMLRVRELSAASSSAEETDEKPPHY